MLSILLLLIGFVLLIKGADFFVDGSSAIAKTFRVPPVIIGLTIVAIGTSAPEAAVSIAAAVKGDNAIAISNVIGSNMFNLLIVVGVCSAIKTMNVNKSIIKRDFPIIVFVSVLMLVQITDGTYSRTDALLLLVLFVTYLVLVILSALRNKEESAEEIKTLPVWKSLIFIVGGVAAIVFGGDLVVDSASKIALSIGMSQTLVGLTIVAMGTSLPELVTSIVACRKGSSDLAIGNVMGSNLFNILFVIGSSAAITPMKGISKESVIDMSICVGVTALMYLMCFRSAKFHRRQGIFCVILYAIYTAYIIARNYNLLPF